MINILFVEQNQDGTVGGSHYCLLYLVKCLDRYKYNPIIMFYEENDIKAKFVDLGCEVVVYNRQRGKRLKHGFILFQKIYNFIYVNLFPLCSFLLFMIKRKIDLIHLNNSSTAGLEWLLAAKLLRKKCITHERGWMTHRGWKSRFAKYFERIICVSASVRQQLKRIGLEKNSVVLYDGMDPVQFAAKVSHCAIEIRKKFVKNTDIPFIGMVGNFQEWKGQMTLVKAVGILKRKYPELVCLLVGSVSSSNDIDRDYYERLIARIDKLKVREHIIITGYRSDIPDLVNSFDLIVHASILPEPFGMVLLEAMCLNKAVISTGIGGPIEIIENEVSGILVQPGNPNELAQKIDYLLANPDIRFKIGENARKRVNNNYSLNRFSEEINYLYDEIFNI